MKAITSMLGIWRDPIQRHHVAHRIGDFGAPVSVATSEIEGSTVLTLPGDFDGS
jgi:hypothetical protein